MNKKDVLEIRKQFSHSNCTITRMCGCYVDHEKEKKFEHKTAFLSMPEEETFKYFELFKKTLSGSIGKNLLNMEFPLEQEKEGGTQEFLLRLRNSKLEDDELIEEFYDKIINHYEYGENYYIILIHAVYDVPGKSLDGMEMFDASDSVYEYVLCSICPVKLSKGGLTYNAEKNFIENRLRDWIVEAPTTGFLFPAYQDSGADIHNLLYYSKKPDDIQPDFIDQVLGSNMPLTAEDQKESFHTIITDTLGDDCDYEVVKNIHENLLDLITEHKEDPEPLEISKPEVKRLLEQSSVPEDKIEIFEKEYENIVGEKNVLMASNLIDTKKFNIETADISIKVNPDMVDLIETRMINNRKYLLIAVDDYIEINGVAVKTIAQKNIQNEMDDELPQ